MFVRFEIGMKWRLRTLFSSNDKWLEKGKKSRLSIVQDSW